MLVSALRYTRKFNLGNYESEDIAIEAVPDDGQTAEELLSACRDFVMNSRGLPKGAPVSNGKPSAAPPLANGNGKPSSSDPTSTAANQSGKTHTRNEPPAAEPPKKRGRPPKALAEAQAAVKAASNAENMDDLLKHFNEARDKSAAFALSDWEQCVHVLEGVYRKLNGPDVKQETQDAVIAAFKSTRTAIAERRAAEGPSNAALAS